MTGRQTLEISTCHVINYELSSLWAHKIYYNNTSPQPTQFLCLLDIKTIKNILALVKCCKQRSKIFFFPTFFRPKINFVMTKFNIHIHNLPLLDVGVFFPLFKTEEANIDCKIPTIFKFISIGIFQGFSNKINFLIAFSVSSKKYELNRALHNYSFNIL